MDQPEPSPLQTSPPAPVTDSPAPATTEVSDAAHKSALLIVFLVVVIDLLGWGIVLPLLPRLGKDFIPGGEENVWTGTIVGLLMAAFSAMQFVFAPAWGRLSDRIGRRPVLLIGLFSSVLFNLLFGIASLMGAEGMKELGLILLFVSRLGAGIAGATLGTAQAVIADSTTPERRSRGMALIGAGFGIGFTFGPILGFGSLKLFPDFAGGPGCLAAALSLMAFLAAARMLPETLRAGAPHRVRRWLDWEGVQLALHTPSVGMLIFIFFLSTFAFAIFEPTLALLTGAPGLGLSTKDNFLIFTYVGVSLALAQGVLYRRLALKVGEVTFMRMGSALMGAGLAGVGGIAWLAEQPDPASSTTLILCLLVVLAVAITGFSFMTPSVQALISRRSDPTRQGEILGVNQSANAMARILGPFTGVELYYLRLSSLTTSHVLPYAAGTVLLLLVFGLTFQLRQE